MKKLTTGIVVLSCAALTACAPANITSAKWDSGASGSSLQTRCERVDMRDKSDMDSAFAKYDGWKMVYASEYTTSNRFGTVGVVCFEKAQ